MVRERVEYLVIQNSLVIQKIVQKEWAYLFVKATLGAYGYVFDLKLVLRPKEIQLKEKKKHN